MSGRVPDQAQVLAHWLPGDTAAVGEKVSRFLAASHIVADTDTLGERNQRIFSLYRALIGGAIQAQIACSVCNALTELDLPVDAILALPPPARDVIWKGRRFRLPTMADLGAMTDPAELALLCALDPGPPLDEAAVIDLAQLWEEADPAGVIRLDLACHECGHAIAATADPARFLAAGLDRLARRILVEIDLIARSYGWAEPEIMRLPPSRRADYVALITRNTQSSPHIARIGGAR